MDIISLYRNFNIEFRTEGHKHCREGWVNTPCPFCMGNFGYHLGFNISDEYYVCWRCGGHGVKQTLHLLLNLPYNKVMGILKQYGDTPSIVTKPQKIKIKKLQFPSNILTELPDSHRRYLKNREFDPDEIKHQWKIMATTHYSQINGLDFKHRIIIPIFWNGEIVSYLGRSIHPDNELRYLVCPEQYEAVNIKKTIYGNPAKYKDLGICVEGVTDVWRVGPTSFALYGIKYKPEQVRIIAKTFKRVVVLFDDDAQAQQQANKLVADLRFRGVDSYKHTIKGDPGALSKQDAFDLVRDLQTFKIK